ncbi:hypothetical protein [Acanthopleuribacter pedis]|uniref:LysM domain-containing protein n=1 Tax=Acanthopleuribacter pedis TaxID=442870 RepID=A0A8J7Q9U6_9BACT|nr:hypothetical protein [Acanthopleuribacter pedis]MBO1321376.1 hypothetical protein [Acanthopleuribacter pedis]
MSIESLYQAFAKAVRERHIGPDVLPLMGQLTTALGVRFLALSGGQAEQLPTAARLVATTIWPEHPGEKKVRDPEWTLRLIGTLDDLGRDQLALTLQAQTEGGFVSISGLVADVPHSPMPDPNVGGGITKGPSIFEKLGLNQTEVTLTVVDEPHPSPPLPTLSGWLAGNHEAMEKVWGWTDSLRLSVSGTIDPRKDAKVVDKVNLDAVLPFSNRDWAGKLNIDAVLLRLTTNYGDIFSWQVPPPRCCVALLVLQVVVQSPTRHVVEISVPPGLSSHLLDVSGQANPPFTLGDGLSALMKLFPGAPLDTFALPSGVAPLHEFELAFLRVGIETEEKDFDSFSAPVPIGLAFTSVGVRSNTRWDLPTPYMAIQDVGASWFVRWDGAEQAYWEGSLFGTMIFGDPGDDDPGTHSALSERPERDLKAYALLDVTADLTNLSVAARARYPFKLDLAKAMAEFFPGTQPVVGKGLVVDFITMDANLYQHTFGAALRVHGDWLIKAGNIAFTLEDLSFNVTLNASSKWGGLQGIAAVFAANTGETGDGSGEEPVEPLARLSVGAYYPGDGVWTFQGGLMGKPLSLVEWVTVFLGEAAPAWLTEDPSLDVSLTKLWVKYATAEGNPYAVSAGLATLWQPTLFNITLGMAAETDIVYRKRIKDDQHDALLPAAAPADEDGAGPDMVYEATVKGAFTVNNLVITAGVSLQDDEQTWLFRVQLDQFLLEGTSAYIGTGDDRHQVIRVVMHGVSFGTMVSSLAALANPNANYQLPEPWTFLDHIHMGDFTLLVDPVKQRVSFDYQTKIHLGFITVEGVGVRYDRDSGAPRVFIEITGSFLGKTYGSGPDDQPLSWDALNDSPPEVPGEGDLLVNLRYLGLGQHLALAGLTKPDSVADVLALMQEQMKPAVASRNPLDQPGGEKMTFDEGSQWLVGADLTVLNTATIQLVMHDPDLYGVLIALSGTRAGVLAGFRFELLYKKISEDVGVFHGRLQVPTAFRHLNLGAVALTLGVIAVDIYTNGDFKVDLGFPHNRDFKNSFGLTYGAFTGVGGMYFGKLSGATSSKVPAISNGNFSPVLELGVGLAVRTGRSIKEGPLAASLYVQLEVLFEGVLAWFNPDDASVSEATYYSAVGMAKLVGKLCGKVNFKVIAIDISVDAVASVTLQMEAYRRTLIEMVINVQAHAKVRVGFVKVSFSFKIRLDASFVVGADATTPWVLAGDDGTGPGRGQLEPAAVHGGALPAANASRLRRSRLRWRRADVARRLRLQALGVSPMCANARTPEEPYVLNFSPDVQVFDAVQSLDIRLLPAYTVADADLIWPGQGYPSGRKTHYRIVFLLTIDGPLPVDAVGLDQTRAGAFTPTARARDPSETPFAVLGDALFRWALTAAGVDLAGDQLDAGKLDLLAAQLDDPQTFARGFSFDNLSGFLGNNLSLRVSGQPKGNPPDDLSGVAFPMPPVLKWETEDLKKQDNKRNFAAYQPVDNEYAKLVAAEFAGLSPAGVDGDPDSGGIEKNESLASVVFREYLLLVTKSMVQAARNLFDAFPVDLAADSTLDEVAASFPTVAMGYIVHRGDTTEQVAAHFGVDEAALIVLNPDLGQILASEPPGTKISVQLGVTPESIAAANPEQGLAYPQAFFNLALQTQIHQGDTPNTLCSRLGAQTGDWLVRAAALDAPITLAGAALTVPSDTFYNPTGLTLTQVAALFYVRFHAGTQVVLQAPRVNWYAEAITALNGSDIGAEGALPDRVKVPAGYNQLGVEPVLWTRLVGDSLGRLAAVTALWQNPDADPAFAAWLAELEAANKDREFIDVIIPAADLVVLPDETLRNLATRTLRVRKQNYTGPDSEAVPSAKFDRLVENAVVLKPLAPVVVTPCTLQTLDGDTVRAFATRYDLPLEFVGSLGAAVKGWFVPGHQPLNVTHLAAVTLSALMPNLLADTPVRDVAGQVSRFMLHGQRLPVPADTTKRAGLYELIGQQVVGPAPSPGFGKVVTLTVAPSVAVNWLQLVQTETAVVGDDPAADLAAYRRRVPDFARHNPAANAGGLRTGLVLDMGARQDQELTLVITKGMLNTSYPARTLAVKLFQNPAPMALSQTVPIRHGLARGLMWHTARRPDLGVGKAPVVGMPSLWALPHATTQSKAAAKGGAWQLYAADPGLGPDAPAAAVAGFTWATRLDIRVNRVPGSPHLVDVVGADPVDREVLFQLWQFLKQGKDTADLWLGFSRSPAAGLATGLSSPAVDGHASFIVRTNLSTETHAGPTDVSVGAEGEQETKSALFYAPLADACSFLTLLWEASVVGGGGYWWHLTDTLGNGFPPDVFGDEGGGIVTLVAVLKSQTGAKPNRALHPFTTAAYVDGPVDGHNTDLYVAAADGCDRVAIATLAPGRVGFTMGVTFPWEDENDSLKKTRRLYNLAGYQLLAAKGFHGSEPGLPVGGQADNPDDEKQTLSQVIPIHRFAEKSLVPTGAGNPPAEEDPYAGIAAQGTSKPARVTVALSFQDVFGNRTYKETES